MTNFNVSHYSCLTLTYYLPLPMAPVSSLLKQQGQQNTGGPAGHLIKLNEYSTASLASP